MNLKYYGTNFLYFWRAGLLVSLIFIVSPPANSQSRFNKVQLGGEWRFSLDRDDLGVRGEWFRRDLPLRIRLPGVLQAQNYGDLISTNTPWVLSLYDRYWYLRDEYKPYINTGNVKVPFLSQPPRHYLGPAWYQRDITIQRFMVGRRIVLTLERPHWETTVWVDDKRIGSDISLVAPHIYDLGSLPAGNHRLTIRVDNRLIMPYRPDAHSVSDSLAGTWNGIVGDIHLTDTDRVWLDDVQVFPNVEKKTLLIKVRVGNITGRSGHGTISATAPDAGAAPVFWDENGGTAELEVPLRPEAQTWDEFHPILIPLKLWLKAPAVDDYKELNIGMRDLHTEGKEFILNGHPIIFRGTHSGGDFPLTGYPPTDVQSWQKLFEICRAWGLNHMRFHSWCPPEAAFEAADKLGFYIQAEPGMWNEISPDTPMEKMLYDETERMIRAYGNHPSFMLLSASNEPKGKWKESLSKWVDYYHKRDPRHLYASGTGHTEREVPDIAKGTDYLAVQRIGQLMLRRESGWFGSDYNQSLIDIDVPVIAHEVGQWDAYPDYDIIKSFTGYMRPGNYEIFRDSMKAHGLLEKNKEFARASGQFQVLCYKEEIEANLRTAGLGGFQLLDLHDYLGQGTALVGLLDAFWQPKGYVQPDEFKEFCNTTVPLARLTKRVFTTDEVFNADLEVAHYGAEPIQEGQGVWQITRDKVLEHGQSDPHEIPIGKNYSLGKASLDLARYGPGCYKLKLTVAPASFFDTVGQIKSGKDIVRGLTYFQNEWDFWVYPSTQTDQAPIVNPNCPRSRDAEVLVTRSWDEAEAKLRSGGRVLFVPRNVDLGWNSPPLDIVPVFWNRLMGPGWGRMLGLYIDLKQSERKSNALVGFSTSSNFDWNWAYALGNVRAINLDGLPRELEPIVWAIDDWNRNYKLGVIFECAVGDGKLLVSTIDVSKPNDSNPVLRQLRNALLSYAENDCFQPNVSVTRGQLRSLFFDTRIMKKLGASVQIGGVAANTVMDSDPNTFALVGDQKAPYYEPAEITISFPAPVVMTGLLLMPRQNHREHEGDIREYSVLVSDDGSAWNELTRGELISTFAPQKIQFGKTVTTRYLKLVALSGFGPDKTMALAELAVLYAGPRLIEKSDGTIDYQRNQSATADIDEGPGTPKPKPSPTPTRKKP